MPGLRLCQRLISFGCISLNERVLRERERYYTIVGPRVQNTTRLRPPRGNAPLRINLDARHAIRAVDVRLRHDVVALVALVVRDAPQQLPAHLAVVR